MKGMIRMADITRLGEISLPKLSENMAPEDRRAINNYLMQLRDQTMYMLRNLDESNFSDAMRDKLTAMGLKMEYTSQSTLRIASSPGKKDSLRPEGDGAASDRGRMALGRPGNDTRPKKFYEHANVMALR